MTRVCLMKLAVNQKRRRRMKGRIYFLVCSDTIFIRYLKQLPREIEKSLGNDEPAWIEQVGSRYHRQNHHGCTPQNHFLRIDRNEYQ